MRFGNLQLDIVHENDFKIDGGAMFGVVPKIIWENLAPPDERNLIRLAANLLLIQTGRENILVDAGLGEALDERQRKILGVERPSNLLAGLRKHGLRPTDIDILILTHLHLDHAGGTFSIDGGDIVPTLPRARHLVQRSEWEDAMVPNERTRATYDPERLQVIQERGLLQLLDGDEEILPGIQVLATGGHTKGHQAVQIKSQGKTALYPGDMVPTPSHIQTPYIAGVDTFPLETLQWKQKVLSQALSEGWLLIFDHAPSVKMGYLKQDGKRMALQPAPS